jgi:hypothetical protein
VLDRKKLAAFSALGGGFLRFPIGDAKGLIGPDCARKPREAKPEIPSAHSATNSILIAYLANPSIREVDF